MLEDAVGAEPATEVVGKRAHAETTIDRAGRSLVTVGLAQAEHILGVGGALERGEARRALGRDRGDHAHRVPGAGGLHHRRAADRGPGGAGVVVRADARLVGEVDRGVLGLGSGRDGRVGLGLPPLDRLGSCW